MLIIQWKGLLPILKVPHQALSVLSAAAAGTAARTTALQAYGTTTVLPTGTTILASAWLVCLRFTHFAGEVEQLRAQRKPPEAVKPNRQNVLSGAVNI